MLKKHSYSFIYLFIYSFLSCDIIVCLLLVTGFHRMRTLHQINILQCQDAEWVVICIFDAITIKQRDLGDNEVWNGTCQVSHAHPLTKARVWKARNNYM